MHTRRFRHVMCRLGFTGTVALFAASLFCIPATADVTAQYRIGVVGAGFLEMANLHGTSTTTLSNDKSRVSSEIQMESGLMRSLTRNAGPSTTITRIDQDRILQLNDKKRTYTETSFAEERAQLNDAMEKTQKSLASQQETTTGVDEAQCEWQEPKIDIKKTGEKATVAGYQTERLIIGATQACKLKKSNQVCEFGISLDQWLAQGFDAASELQAYEHAYAEKMGLTANGSREFAERAQSYFGRYKEMMRALASKSVDIKGYPIKSSIALGVGGPQCQSTENAAKNAPPKMGDLMGGLLGSKKASAPASAPATTPTGLTAIITVNNELISVSKNTVDPQSFEPPADYKRVKK